MSEDDDDENFVSGSPVRPTCDGEIHPTTVVSQSLADHFRPIMKSRSDQEDAFFSYRYFLKTKAFITKRERDTPANTAMKKLLEICPNPRISAFSQGSLHFAYESRDEVLKMISLDIRQACPMYWNQMAYDKEGEGCRLVVDIDSNERVVPDDQICRISNVLWQTLKAYYPKDFATVPIDIYVAKCGPRIKKGKLSTGIHIIAHVKVNFQQYKQLMFGFKSRLQADSTLDMKGLEVDDDIYKASGYCSLRMIFCNKVEKCPLCKNEVSLRQACDFCDRMGEVISKSTYEPLCCINPTTGINDPAYFQQHNGDFLEILKNYSIWPEARDSAHEFIRPETDPNYVSTTGSQRKSSAAEAKKHMKKIKATDPVYELLQEFIRDISYNGKKWWERIIVDNVSLTENQKVAWVSVTGLCATMCPYAQKDHGDNRIYFLVTRGGQITVRCRSKKVEYGCQTKPRISFSLPGTITQQIFGISGPPNVLRSSGPRSAEEKNLTYHEFVRKQGKVGITRKDMRKTESNLRQENRLKHLSTFYSLGK